ncbi:unnamed protein product, partial [Medioppia subpectinata]
PIAVALTRDGQPFDAGVENRYQVIRNETSGVDAVWLRIHILDTTRRDSALYTCIASNKYGRDEFNHQIIVQEAPDIPENVMVNEITSRTALLSWLEPYAGNAIIIKYRLEMKQSLNGWQSSPQSSLPGDNTVESIPGTDTSYIIRGLKPVTAYTLRLSAENKLGFSANCTDIHFNTGEE